MLRPESDGRAESLHAYYQSAHQICAGRLRVMNNSGVTLTAFRMARLHGSYRVRSRKDSDGPPATN